MEDQTQKILALQEEIISLQKSSYSNSLESIKKVYVYKQANITLLVIALLALVSALVAILLYYR